MSRTYRKYPSCKYVAYGIFWTDEECNKIYQEEIKNGYSNKCRTNYSRFASHSSSWEYRIFYSKQKNKDGSHKFWMTSPPKSYKKMRNRQQRAKFKHAIIHDKELCPVHKTYRYDYW